MLENRVNRWEGEGNGEGNQNFGKQEKRLVNGQGDLALASDLAGGCCFDREEGNAPRRSRKRGFIGAAEIVK